jgi:hypothetical protein
MPSHLIPECHLLIQLLPICYLKLPLPNSLLLLNNLCIIHLLFYFLSKEIFVGQVVELTLLLELHLKLLIVLQSGVLPIHQVLVLLLLSFLLLKFLILHLSHHFSL